MESRNSFKRSDSNSRAAFLIDGIAARPSNGETPIEMDLEDLSLSRRIARSVTPKFQQKKDGSKKKKKKKKKNARNSSSGGYLTRYVRCGGCRVGACDDFGIVRIRPGASEDCMLHRLVSGVEKVDVECFSYGATDMFCKKNTRKAKDVDQPLPSPGMSISLPDDLLEVILSRLPFASLVAARCVCKKWRCLTSTPHFMQMRSGNGSRLSPWLFLFGIGRDRRSGGEIHALDVSLDRWHRINSDVLNNRSLFSVAGIRDELYIVGGCSSAANSNVPLEISSLKVHKGVLVFNPLSGLWREAAPMNSARSQPVLGVFEISNRCSIFLKKADRQAKLHHKSRVGRISDVYEDPHRFSLRRQLREGLNESHSSSEARGAASSFHPREDTDHSKFVLIAVGGHGSWDEPLETGEIYDPATNRWIEIAKLPGDFGCVCSGAVCSGKFYVYSDTDKLAGYDLERGFWVMIQMSHPPPHLHEYNHNLVSCRTRLFMLCVSWCDRDGMLNRREKAVRKLWEFDLWSHSWSEVSRHPDAPMDWNAMFVADGDQIYGVEMFKIFGQVLDFLTVCTVSENELKWSRASRKHSAVEADAASFMSKSMAVVHL